MLWFHIYGGPSGRTMPPRKGMPEPINLDITNSPNSEFEDDNFEHRELYSTDDWTKAANELNKRLGGGGKVVLALSLEPTEMTKDEMAEFGIMMIRLWDTYSLELYEG